MRHEDAKDQLHLLIQSIEQYHALKTAGKDETPEATRLRNDINRCYGELRDTVLKVAKKYKLSIDGGRNIHACYERAFGTQGGVVDIACIQPHINKVLGQVNALSLKEWKMLTKPSARKKNKLREQRESNPRRGDKKGLGTWMWDNAAKLIEVVVGAVIALIKG